MPTNPPVPKLQIFPVSPRHRDPVRQIQDVGRVAKFADLNNLTGILLFTGNDAAIEPWALAQHVLEATRNISPLIAVNPMYMHPFTVAKLVSSMTHLYGRRIYLNMVTGTSSSDAIVLGEAFSHSERYARLGEFISVVRSLLGSSRPLVFPGQFYRVHNAQIYPKISSGDLPEFLIAGQSDDARKLAGTLGCLQMQMLPEDLEAGLIETPGINLGIVTREKSEQAWEAAHRLFPEDPESRTMQQLTLQNTDSVWKRKLYEAGSQERERETAYWLGPFMSSQADCPYLVGDYNCIAASIRQLMTRGVRTIILDVLPSVDELQHICNALGLSGVL